MMNLKTKTKELLKKGITWLVTWSLLATQVASAVPAHAQAGASASGYELVAILVEEGIFTRPLQGKIERYAEDVQNALPGVKSQILITKPDEQIENIAAVLEKLYLEEKLVGVVLIGNIPLPDDMFVYTDFDDAQPADIWHGVINSSQEGNARLAELAAYFDKNHKFHEGDPEYARFDQKILFGDLIFEGKALTAATLQTYQNFAEHLEDFAYLRFTKELLAQLQRSFWQRAESATGGNLPGADDNMFSAIPDVQTKPMIEKFAQRYVQLFDAITGKTNAFIRNTGRYDQKRDMFYSLISQKDELLMTNFRMINDSIEKRIDEEVMRLQRNIPIMDSITITGVVKQRNRGAFADIPLVPQRIMNHGQGFFWGQSPESITKAEQCSITRGSTKQVEVNRVHNPRSADDRNAAFAGCHGGNVEQPGRCNAKNATRPVPDLAGTRDITGQNIPKADAQACFDFPNPVEIRLVPFGVTLRQVMDKAGMEQLILTGPRTIELEDEPFPGIGKLTVNLTPNIEKNLPSMVEHKEPSPETITAQVRAQISSALPVDAVRYVTYMDNDFHVQRVNYPNIFAANSLEQFRADLTTAEGILNAPGNLMEILGDRSALDPGDRGYIFETVNTRELEELFAWRSMSLEEKHANLLKNAIEENSYEVLYLAADGKDGEITLDFSSKVQGEIPDIEIETVERERKEKEEEQREQLKDEAEKRSNRAPRYVNSVPLVEYIPYLEKWAKDIAEGKTFDIWTWADKEDEDEFYEKQEETLQQKKEEAIRADDREIRGIRLTGEQAVVNADSNEPMKIFVEAIDQEEIAHQDEVLKLTVTVEGPATTELHDDDPETEGIQTIFFDAASYIPVKATSSAGNVIVKAVLENESADGADGEEIAAQLRVPIKSGIPFALRAESPSLPSDGESETVMILQTDPGISGTVTFQADDPEKGEILEKRVQLENGAARATLRAGRKAGILRVAAALEGFEDARAAVEIMPKEAVYMELSSNVAEITGEDGAVTELTARLYDFDENLLTNDSETVVNFSLSAESGRFGRLSQEHVRAEGGVAKTEFVSNGQMGSLFVTARIQDNDAIPSASLNLRAVLQFKPEDWAGMDANVLYASLRGFTSKTFAEKLLFSGKTQIVTARTKNPDKQHELGAGFGGNDKHILLWSSGHAVGEAVRPYADSFTVNFGDPTIKIDPSGNATGGNYTTDIGRQLGKTSKNISELIAMDVTGNGTDEVLAVENREEITVINGGRNEQILRVKNRIQSVAPVDIDGDGDDDLLVAAQESCRRDEHCLSLYRNENGRFVRELLDIALDEKVFDMKVADMNNDGRNDLVLSDMKGSIKIYYNFGRMPHEIGAIRSEGGDAHIKLFVGHSLGQNTDDGTLDIAASPEGNAGGRVMYFSSRGIDIGGRVIFAENISPEPPRSEAEPPVDAGAAAANRAIPPDINKILDKLAADDDGDGIPNSWDGQHLSIGINMDAENKLAEMIGEVGDSVEEHIRNLTCGGGCIPTPINAAFLVPGNWNVFGVPVGFDPGLPVFAFPAPGIPPFWPAAAQWYPSQFRLYLSPTLTGEIGAAICAGPYTAPTPLTINGLCFASKLPFNMLDIAGAAGAEGLSCKAIQQDAGEMMASANAFLRGVNGQMVVSTTGAAAMPPRAPGAAIGASGGAVQYNMGGFTVPVQTKTNFKVPGFPAILTDWIDKQIEQIASALFDGPDIYLILPDIFDASLGELFIPQSEDEIKSETLMRDILAKINSIPLVQVESREIVVKVPGLLTKKEYDLFLNDHNQWWQDLKIEANRLAESLGCAEFSLADLEPFVPEADRPPRNAVNTICGNLELDLGSIKKDLENNIAAIHEYLMWPHKIASYREAESFYLRQIIGYLNAITDFADGYFKRQDAIVKKWKKEIKNAQDTIQGWKGIMNVFIDFQASCDECKNHRATLLTLMMELFTALPDLPNIPIPHLPDIYLDLSQWRAGTKIIWPDLVLKPEPFVMPKLPRVRLPQIPEITFRLKESIAIPKIPAPPSLPTLPELPPLPLPKLPDLPLPPRLPEFSAELKMTVKSIGKILKILCLLYKGFLPIPETQLKTKIEQMTARGLSPLLPLDLDLQFTTPGFDFEYPELIEIIGKINLQFEMDQIYNAAWNAAKKLNDASGNFVKGVNAQTRELNRTFGEIPIGPDRIPDVKIEIGEDAELLPFKPLIEELEKNLNAYRDQHTKLEKIAADMPQEIRVNVEQEFADPEALISSETDIEDIKQELRQYERRLTAFARPRLTASLAARKSGPVTVKAPLIAQAAPAGNPPADMLRPQTRSAVPSGLFVDGTSILEYKLPTGDNMPLTLADADGDGDEDILFATEGEVYFKENKTRSLDKRPYDGDPEIGELADMIPALPAVKNFKVIGESAREVTLSWSPLESEKLAGYEITYTGAEEKSVVLLLEDTEIEIEQSESRTVEILFDKKQAQFTLELPEGSYTAHIRAIKKGAANEAVFGTASRPVLLYPTICNDTTPPEADAGSDKRIIAVGEETVIDATGSFDNESAIAGYWLDTDIVRDADSNGDPADDRDMIAHDGTFEMEAESAPGTHTVRLWVEDSAGNRAFTDIEIDVRTPQITLNPNSPHQGFLEGEVKPVNDRQEFAAIRKRGGVTSVIGKDMTDATGRYRLEVNLDRSRVVRNNENKIVARISEQTGNIVVEDARYLLETLQNPLRTVLKNEHGEILVTVYIIPDVNSDVTVGNEGRLFDGIRVKDSEEDDECSVRFLTGDHAEYPGGAEIVCEEKRAAVIETNGNIILQDNRLTVRMKKAEQLHAAPVYEIMDGGRMVAEVEVLVGMKKTTVVPAGKIVKTQSRALPKRPKWAGKKNPFKDVPEDHPRSELINEFYRAGVLQGYEDGTFRPDDTVTRAEYAKIVLKTLCIVPRPQSHEPPPVFADIPFVSNIPWFYAVVKESFLRNFIKGYLREINENGLAPFKPLADINRAEAVKIILEALRTEKIMDFKDQTPEKGAAWYAPYLRIAENIRPYLKLAEEVSEAFIVTAAEAGDPRKALTRAEFVEMAGRVLHARNCFLDDTDADGMPDYWEDEHELNPDSPNDPDDDPDRDGLTNVEEFEYGTDPNNPDTDGGGVNDFDEIQNGTNPVDDPSDDVPRAGTVRVPQDTDDGADGDTDDDTDGDTDDDTVEGEPPTDQGPKEEGEGFVIEPGECGACPCAGYLDDAADLIPGDEVFTVIGNDDLTEIFSRSEIVTF